MHANAMQPVSLGVMHVGDTLVTIYSPFTLLVYQKLVYGNILQLTKTKTVLFCTVLSGR
jgi:hypothetical protein